LQRNIYLWKKAVTTMKNFSGAPHHSERLMPLEASEVASLEREARRMRAQYVAGLLVAFGGWLARLARTTRAPAQACTAARLRHN
jgi:hypothetical protein